MSRDYKNRIPGYARPKRRKAPPAWVVPGVAMVLVVLGFITIILAGSDDEISATPPLKLSDAEVKDPGAALPVPAEAKSSESKATDKVNKSDKPLVLPTVPIVSSTTAPVVPGVSAIPLQLPMPSVATSPAPPPSVANAAAPLKSGSEVTAANATPKAAAQPTQPVVVKPKVVEPRFSFYKLLPEKELLIPENEIRTLKREEVLGKSLQIAGGYVLQAGSFLSKDEAMQLRNRLSKLKVKGRMEAVVVDSVTWFRVNVGPYSSLVDADKMRAYLRHNDIDSVVQRDSAQSPP